MQSKTTATGGPIHSANSSIDAQSAAQQVFGLPELLERILLYVSLERDDRHPPRVSDRTSREHASSDLFPDPSKALFILQRVNSAFQATIQRNKTLQQRMSLQPCKNGQSPWNTLSWLVTRIGVFDPDNRLLCRYDDDDSVSLDYSHTKEYSTSAWPWNDHENPDSSWRKMKLHCTGEPITVEYLSWPHDTHGSYKLETGNWDDVTLGKIHDGLQRMWPFVVRYEAMYSRGGHGIRNDEQLNAERLVASQDLAREAARQ